MLPSFTMLLPAGLAAFATVLGMAVLRPFAPAMQLLDVPRGHKTHSGAVPVVGGLAMYVGLAVALLVLDGVAYNLPMYLVSGGCLVVIGALDDAFELSPWLRLAGQVGAAAALYLSPNSGVRLIELGNLFGFGNVMVLPLALPLTVLVVVAAINAFNMLDGLDGLAGGVALMALVLLLIALPGPLAPSYLQIVYVLTGAIVGFLLFNAPLGFNRRLRSFMGDAGSTLLGFTLATVLIGGSQGATRAAEPVTMLWLMFVPAVDLVWSVIRRIVDGRSPFAADNSHLHHLLQQAGMSSRASAMSLVGLALVVGAAGLELDRLGTPAWLSLLLLISTGVVVIAAIYRAEPLVMAVGARWSRAP